MSVYIALVRFTEKGIARVKESPKTPSRVDAMPARTLPPLFSGTPSSPMLCYKRTSVLDNDRLWRNEGGEAANRGKLDAEQPASNLSSVTNR